MSISESQKLQYITIRDLEEYFIITLPLDCTIEISGAHIHIRKKVKKNENKK